MVILWILLILVVLGQLPSLVREKQWGEVAAFTFMWVVAAVYATVVIGEILTTNPTQIIIRVMETISRLVTGKSSIS